MGIKKETGMTWLYYKDTENGETKMPSAECVPEAILLSKLRGKQIICTRNALRQVTVPLRAILLDNIKTFSNLSSQRLDQLCILLQI